MRHRSIVRRVALAGLAAALLAACGSSGDDAPLAPAQKVQPGTVELIAFAGLRATPSKDAPVAATVEGMQAFAADLYRIAASPEENLVFSPLSIEYAFAMLRAGAAGTSAEQLDKTFGFPSEIAAAVNALTVGLVTDKAPPLPAPPPEGDKPEGERHPPPSDPILAVSNALFSQRGYAYVEAFLRTMREQYDAGLHTVDFADQAAALAAINGWADEQTRGRITKVLERLDPMTRLAIANAVYLKASWPTPFEDPSSGDFRVGDQTVRVPTLRKNSSLGYATGPDWRSVTLPYFGDRLAMRLILPTGDSAPADLMNTRTLTAAGRTKPTDVVLTMPMWDFGADLDLKKMLPELGLTDIFDGRANLSGITASEQLMVDQALHKANITVDQLGTEAAAVTVITTVPLSGRIGPPPVQFTVDRPFLFEIVDTKTGAPLFVGQVVDPRAK